MVGHGGAKPLAPVVGQHGDLPDPADGAPAQAVAGGDNLPADVNDEGVAVRVGGDEGKGLRHARPAVAAANVGRGGHVGRF